MPRSMTMVRGVPRKKTMLSRFTKRLTRPFTFTRKRSPTLIDVKTTDFAAFFYAPRTVLYKRNVYVIVYKWEGDGYSKTIYVTENEYTHPMKLDELMTIHQMQKDIARLRKKDLYNMEDITPTGLYDILKDKIGSVYTSKWFEEMVEEINKLKPS